MTIKGPNAKRLAIYLLIVFAASITLILFHRVTDESRTAFFLVQQLFCWSPAIACIVTRALTKEGFRDMKLHFRLRGNFGYYLTAFVLPLTFVPAFMIIPAVMKGNTGWISMVSASDTAAVIFQLAATAVFGSVGLLGEELGWRGYMNQKMEPLFGTFGTCIIGGIIWGLWHVPIDAASYLLGYIKLSEMLRDSAERMFILIMLSVILMWLTKKTDSVFPAVILHAAYNGTVSVVDGMTGGGTAAKFGVENVIGYLPLFMIAAVFMILLLKGNKKSEKAEKNA